MWSAWIGLAMIPGPQDETVELSFRVTAVQKGGWVGVDRGEEDGLVEGTRVRFEATGRELLGTVDSAEPRTALVLLDRRNAALAPGMKGKADVVVPEVRAPEAVNEPVPLQGWTPEMPLLARVGELPTEERAPHFYGRTWLSLDATTSDADRSQSFARGGFQLTYENPWERGGVLELDGEITGRDTSAPFSDNESTRTLRLDRANYSRGGRRSEPYGWTAGRFLQQVPELGMLDGGEAHQRFHNGDRAGVSIGFEPEYDEALHSAEDFQLAAWYQWNRDPSERTSVTGAVRKSWHNGSQDRQQLFAKVHHLPAEGWRFHGAGWLDLEPDVELSRLHANASRTFTTGTGVTVGLSRWELVDLDRDQGVTLPDGGTDRVHVEAWRPVEGDRTLSAYASLWNGDGESGYFGEVSLESPNVWIDDASSTLTAFVGRGLYEDQKGLRWHYAVPVPDGELAGTWDATLEWSTFDVEGFDVNANELAHARVRAARSVYDLWGWHASAYAAIDFEDHETVFALGFHFTRGF